MFYMLMTLNCSVLDSAVHAATLAGHCPCPEAGGLETGTFFLGGICSARWSSTLLEVLREPAESDTQLKRRNAHGVIIMGSSIKFN